MNDSETGPDLHREADSKSPEADSTREPPSHWLKRKVKTGEGDVEDTLDRFAALFREAVNEGVKNSATKHHAMTMSREVPSEKGTIAQFLVKDSSK